MLFQQYKYNVQVCVIAGILYIGRFARLVDIQMHSLNAFNKHFLIHVHMCQFYSAYTITIRKTCAKVHRFYFYIDAHSENHLHWPFDNETEFAVF